MNLTQKMLKLFFEQKLKDLFEANVYIKKLNKTHKKLFSFSESTSHSSGQLQRMLLGEG